MTKGVRPYHKGDRRRMAAAVRADIPDMDGEMRALACQTSTKPDAMSDTDIEARRFQFSDG